MKKWRLGVVSYLNARPLIAGLSARSDMDLFLNVPSRLATLLEDGSVDVALIPVIEWARNQEKWDIISDACIGCDGETFTVRIFSRIPPAEIRTLQVDGDSRTSVALARVIWRELYHRKLVLQPYSGSERTDDCDAVLLIGDKVVNHSLVDFDIETDLGQAWKSMTSLPFVFAVWACPRELESADIARLLSDARDAGVMAAPMIAADYGPGMGWPVNLAKRYLTSRLKFCLGPRERKGMEMFLELARKHNLLERNQEPVPA